MEILNNLTNNKLSFKNVINLFCLLFEVGSKSFDEYISTKSPLFNVINTRGVKLLKIILRNIGSDIFLIIAITLRKLPSFLNDTPFLRKQFDNGFNEFFLLFKNKSW